MEAMNGKLKTGEVRVEVVSGVEGPCLCVSNEDGSGVRIAGPKPWGGGTTIHRFKVSAADLAEAATERAK
jgi:hypothetical protein